MATRVNKNIDWITDDEGFVVGYDRGLRRAVGIPRVSDDGQGLVFPDQSDPIARINERLDYNSIDNVAWKLKNFYRALYAGITISGGVATRPKNIVRVGVFGDSVGNSKPIFVLNRLKQSLNLAGGFFSTIYPQAGATAVKNTNSGDYWINGAHYVLPSGGNIIFQQGGGRAICTKIQLFYIKEPGAGAFKVQTRNTGGAYVDEVGYASVDASDSSIGVGVITLTKAYGAWDMNVVGLNGTCRFVGAAYEDEIEGGICVYQFDVGGLPLATSNQTPLPIKSAVLNAIGLDACFMEFKDGSTFSGDFAEWMSFWSGNITKPVDWVFIGTSPEEVEQTSGSKDAVNNNAVLRAYAEANDSIYFDGYTPLRSWAEVNAAGWGGDGTHLSAAAHAFVANQLYRYLGFDVLLETPFGGEFRATRLIELAGGSAKLIWKRDAVTVGEMLAKSDVELRGSRGWLYKNSNGDNRAFVACNGGTGHTFTSMSFGVPFTASLPTMHPSGTNGVYLSNGAANGVPTAWFAAKSYKVGGSIYGPEIFSGDGSPEGQITATPGSIYLRSDGGAGSGFYVKETGTGNTGWSAK